MEWLNVVYEPPPPADAWEAFASYLRLHSDGTNAGHARAMWSMALLDLYTNATFIAQTDSGALFHMFVLKEDLISVEGMPHNFGYMMIHVGSQ